MSERILIQSFHVESDPLVCEQYIEGHQNVLRSYGVEPVSSAKKEWTTNPNVYGVIARRGDEIIGGVKIHKVGEGYLLPVEEAVGYMDERLYALVADKNRDGAGEACGLWNARSVSGMGLSRIMMLAIVALAEQLEMTYLFGLSSDHTIKLFESLGYRIDHSLGDNGDFVYPTPEYLARVILMNSKTLEGADPYNRQTIMDLRERPNQHRSIQTKSGEEVFEFRLRLPSYVKM